jgi:hypothetical protein
MSESWDSALAGGSGLRHFCRLRAGVNGQVPAEPRQNTPGTKNKFLRSGFPNPQPLWVGDSFFPSV